MVAFFSDAFNCVFGISFSIVKNWIKDDTLISINFFDHFLSPRHGKASYRDVTTELKVKYFWQILPFHLCSF